MIKIFLLIGFFLILCSETRKEGVLYRNEIFYNFAAPKKGVFFEGKTAIFTFFDILHHWFSYNYKIMSQ